MATATETPIYDPSLLTEQLGAATPANPVATQADLINLAGGAPQWVAGAQKAGALVFDGGIVYRVKLDIANGQARPAAFPNGYLALAYDDTAVQAALLALSKQVIRWDLESIKTLSDIPGDSLNYVSGNAYLLNASGNNRVAGLRAASNRVANGDHVGVRAPAGGPDYVLQASSLPAFGSSAGAASMTLLAGVQYEFHAVLPNVSNTRDAYWVVHSTPSTGSGTPGTARDPYDVDTAKRKEVVDANVPAYLETNTDYYGKSFVDEVYGPGQPAMYRCMPSAPATSSGVTVWKWFRSDIL